MDLKSKKLIYFKGFLFLFAMFLTPILIFIECLNWKVLALTLVAMWSAARFYYFMFYVIEHYTDPSYKFSGITSFIKYLLKKK